MKPSPTAANALANCPRCGAQLGPESPGQCPCCGIELGAAARTSTPSKLSMAPGLGLGLGPVARSTRPAAPPSSATLASTEERLRLVARHPQYARWCAERPSGIGHILGLGLVAVLGLVFSVLPLLGTLRGKGHDGALPVALFVLVGLGMTAIGTWLLVRFLRAPLLHRSAIVRDERTHTRRTKSGWRTSHHASFEFEDGELREFPVSSALAAGISRGDVGLAITRDRVLLAFRRA